MNSKKNQLRPDPAFGGNFKFQKACSGSDAPRHVAAASVQRCWCSSCGADFLIVVARGFLRATCKKVSVLFAVQKVAPPIEPDAARL
jgi:hypothetical protein